MEEYMHLVIHHGGEFINNDLTLYEGGRFEDLKIDIYKWSFFELVILKELGYIEIYTIY